MNQETVTSLFDYLESKSKEIRAISEAVEAVDGSQRQRKGNRDGRSREEWRRQAEAEAIEDFEAINVGKSISKAASDRGISYSQMKRRLKRLNK